MLEKLFLSTLLILLKGYRFIISPFLQVLSGPGAGCRFEPTCSEYAGEALRRQGVRRGLGLTFWRVCKCHPWGGRGGYDPVPFSSQNIDIKK